MAVGSLKRSSLTAYAKYDSMLAGNTFTPTTFDYEHLGTVTLTSSQASVVFNLNGYATDYKHLQIRSTTRTNRSGQVNDRVYIYVNGDKTTAAWPWHNLYGDGSSIASSWGGGLYGSLLVENGSAGDAATAGQFVPNITDILDPFSTTKNKTFRVWGGGLGRVQLTSGAWLNTSAVTSISMEAIGSFVSGSRFSLYGLKGSNA